MKKLKIVLSVLVISAVILSIFGCSKTEKIGELTIVIKDGKKYIDCSEFSERENKDIHLSYALIPVSFSSEKEFLTSIRNYSFTDAQKKQMGRLAIGDQLIAMPALKSSTNLVCSSNMTLNQVDWYGGDHCRYRYTIQYHNNEIGLVYIPIMDKEDAVEFIAERNEVLTIPYERIEYTFNNISYTQTTITSIYDIPDKYYQEIYWDYTIGSSIYYVHQYKRATSKSLLESSPYTGARIVIKDSYGYHEILINDSTALSITPAFLEQLQVAAVTIETKS